MHNIILISRRQQKQRFSLTYPGIVIDIIDAKVHDCKIMFTLDL